VSIHAEVLHYTVKYRFEHDIESLTEGLAYDPLSGKLLESTGKVNDCSITKWKIEDYKNYNETLYTDYCERTQQGDTGAGLTIFNNLIYQLLWNKQGLIYNLDNLQTIGSPFKIQTQECWGLATDGESLIMSDGSSTLYFLDSNFTIKSTINVTLDGKLFDVGARRTNGLNELEYVNGYVWANVWHTFNILIINPKTGVVRAILDLSGIYSPLNPDETLNGIAYDSVSNRIFITGSGWNTLFQIDTPTIPQETTQSTASTTVVINATLPTAHPPTSVSEPPSTVYDGDSPSKDEVNTSAVTQAIVMMMVILGKGLTLFTTYFRRF